jgi:acetyl esterase
MRSSNFLILLCFVVFSQSLVNGQESKKNAARADNQPEKKKNEGAHPPTIAGAQEEVYKKVGDVSLNAYIFKPKAPPTDPRPAIVFFFGGGWTSGTPTQFEHQCRYFSERGMVAITADYRVASRHQVKAVDCVADAKSAIRWVRANATRLGIDPDRIVAAGGSAGGHIAAATGTINKFDEPSEDLSISSVPNAMALFNPALALAVGDTKEKNEPDKLAALRQRLGVDAKELSPFNHVGPNVPPTIIFHGKADSTVPYRTAEMFHDAMKQHGRTCELVGFDGAQHGFFNYGRGNGEHYRATVAALDDFLVKLKFLAPK